MRTVFCFILSLLIYLQAQSAENILTCGLVWDLSSESNQAICGTKDFKPGERSYCGKVIAPGLAFEEIMEVQLAASAKPSDQVIYYLNQTSSNDSVDTFLGLKTQGTRILDYAFDLESLHMRWSSRYSFQLTWTFAVNPKKREAIRGAAELEIQLVRSNDRLSKGVFYKGDLIIQSSVENDTIPFGCIYR